MDPRKVLKDLQYRIEKSAPDDPERGNAIRLRDRLLARFGLQLTDITDVRTRREFGDYTLNEAVIVFQYFCKRLGIKDNGVAPYMLESYRRGTGNKQCRNRSIEIDLTDDEYNHHKPIVNNLVEMFAECMRKVERDLRKEAERRREATRYSFCDKANLLNDPDPNQPARQPSWGLSEAMKAARDLEGLVFPDSHLGQEMKRLQSSL